MQILTRSFLTLAAATILFPIPGQAQPVANQPLGSRPGQTFQSGSTAPSQAPGNSSVQSAPVTGNAGTERSASAPIDAGASKATGQANQSSLAAGTPVIMEFSDLQCPDSAQFNGGLKNSILERVSGSKAVYQWRDFPLPVHGQATEAAVAARCAGSSAEKMRQQIMNNQSQLSAPVYAQYAQTLGVDQSAFSACMRSGEAALEVNKDKALGQSLGVRGTPTLVLGTADGRGGVTPVKVVKAYDPPEQVLAEVDRFLASAKGSQAN